MGETSVASVPAVDGMTEFRMPSLGADMEFGTLVEWRVKPGDVIRRGEVIAEVETQKGVIAVEVFHDGTVEELLVPEGTKVPVGTVLARLRELSAGPAVQPAAIVPTIEAARAAPPPPVPEVAVPPAPPPAPVAPAPPVELPSRVRASPLARRMAKDLGISLAGVIGTGVDGTITKRDVERLAAAVAPKPAPLAPAAAVPAMPVPAAAAEERAPAEKLTAMRQAIAAAVSRSKREIPHYYLSADIDLSAALAWMQQENARRSVRDRVLPAALLLKAVARALETFTDFNGFWVDGSYHPAPAIHVGVAISLRSGGLVAPAIHDANRKSVPELTLALLDLVGRARAGGLRGSEVTDPTITVTNLGDQGVDTVFGVIYPPQVSLVGFGRIRERPWAEHGMLGVRSVVTASLAGDHRASDGHRGGLFLREIATLLQSPEQL